ncbi:MAG: hypothetical protein IKQ80_11210, partial [Clostridia bacterium]|nr:hypothetical protein [Clostridia bacterium]
MGIGRRVRFGVRRFGCGGLHARLGIGVSRVGLGLDQFGPGHQRTQGQRPALLAGQVDLRRVLGYDLRRVGGGRFVGRFVGGLVLGGLLVSRLLVVSGLLVVGGLRRLGVSVVSLGLSVVSLGLSVGDLFRLAALGTFPKGEGFWRPRNPAKSEFTSPPLNPVEYGRILT